jgi:uncharacterized cupredoxin-like copper-binding protein
MKVPRTVLLTVVLGVVLGAGIAATAAVPAGAGTPTSTRTIEVTMVDTAFQPTTLDVAAGERITFVFTNAGKIKHDAFIGTVKAQKRHERQMRAAEDDDHGHGGSRTPTALTVKPGRKAKLTYTFERAGTVEIGCHQPGHYAAGMKVTLAIAPA